ncbi:MAG: accessory factor associated with RNA polymerase II [Vezdaea acicularis]|nr:MAG: accessory factor associated with RNA polymerase II [Vezdaea acicularis]
MASTEISSADPLNCLRASIASNSPIIATDSYEPPTSTASLPLDQATHIHFTSPELETFPLTTPTRFISASTSKAVDLRSIYFAWIKKDVAIPEYMSSTAALNAELMQKRGEGVQNLVFVERLDLITWLEGASNESEYIEALPTDAAAIAANGQAGVGAAVAQGQIGGIPVQGGAGGKKVVEGRLGEIYELERGTGDRNTILRGFKQVDFSSVRDLADRLYNQRRDVVRPGVPKPQNGTSAIPGNPNLTVLPKKPGGRRPDPIILLSPSASSLLRLSNIKSFLESGVFTPAEGSSNSTILHISRNLKSIDPSRAFRFILVDTPEQFKPDYWNRVVAVFTTGQTWQFKSYKWEEPTELFRHVLGVYVGWRNEDVPAAVKGWGRGVQSFEVDKWRGEGGRWRDLEAVEGVWGAIEESMRAKGWGGR